MDWVVSHSPEALLHHVPKLSLLFPLILRCLMKAGEQKGLLYTPQEACERVHLFRMYSELEYPVSILFPGHGYTVQEPQVRQNFPIFVHGKPPWLPHLLTPEKVLLTPENVDQPSVIGSTYYSIPEQILM